MLTQIDGYLFDAWVDKERVAGFISLLLDQDAVHQPELRSALDELRAAAVDNDLNRKRISSIERMLLDGQETTYRLPADAVTRLSAYLGKRIRLDIEVEEIRP